MKIIFKQEEQVHISVFLKEVINYLKPKKGDIVLDATTGMGGHSEAILKKIYPSGKLLCVDQDIQAIKFAQNRLAKYKKSTVFVNNNFRNITDILKQAGIKKINGVLLDLGVSSLQFDSPNRGFSIRNDGPLDMRMNNYTELTAYDLVNYLGETELANLIFKNGQERWSKRIAKNIVRIRKSKPIKTTLELAEIVKKSVPRSKKRYRIHPATKTFQALRIAVNQELESLEIFIEKISAFMRAYSRICIISFHSLEDKIVKNYFKKLAKEDIFKIITPKPLIPGKEEINNNHRARSAKMRVAEKL